MSNQRKRPHRSGLTRKSMPPIGEAAGSTSREERMDTGSLDVEGLEELDSMSHEQVARICSHAAVDLVQLGHTIWDLIPDDEDEPGGDDLARTWAQWSVVMDADKAKALLTAYAALLVLRVMMAEE